MFYIQKQEGSCIFVWENLQEKVNVIKRCLLHCFAVCGEGPEPRGFLYGPHSTTEAVPVLEVKFFPLHFFYRFLSFSVCLATLNTVENNQIANITSKKLKIMSHAELNRCNDFISQSGCLVLLLADQHLNSLLKKNTPLFSCRSYSWQVSLSNLLCHGGVIK